MSASAGRRGMTSEDAKTGAAEVRAAARSFAERARGLASISAASGTSGRLVSSRKLGGGLGIAGGAPGINAALEFNQASGYTIIVLSNYDLPSAGNVSEQIRKLVAQIEK